MAVGFCVGFYWYTVGSGDFLQSFFFTIAYRLEKGKWGSRYPIVMKKLYQGMLDAEDLKLASKELHKI